MCKQKIFSRMGMFAALSVFCGPLLMAEVVADARPVASHKANAFELRNNAVGARWTVEDAHLKNFTLLDEMHRTVLQEKLPFSILMKNGMIYNADNLVIAGEPVSRDVVPHPGDPMLAKTIAGKAFDLSLESADHTFHASWSVILLEGSQYIRQELTISAQDVDLPISRVLLVDLPLRSAHVSGSVKGSPIITENIYLGFEEPLSESRVTASRATAWIERDLPLRAGQSIIYSSVFGVVRSGQMRRDFLAYVERERAHPYRTFLHYNSWYDLGYFTPYDQAGAVDRINAFGKELTQKRGVKLDSFLYDDGWDNHNSLWKFNNGFPDGFTPVKNTAEQYQAAPGIWMSPWGGYATPKKERIAFGTKSGYEIVQNGYALSGPKYYAAFRDVCMNMIKTYGINQFKFDGTGNADSVFRGSSFDSDFDAAIHLIGELRAAKPSLFINLTTGTWPSPFWLRYADSIWRGGEDDDFAGVGSYRERWITYRDSDTYQRIVQGGPLFPLNSLMLHGMIYAHFRKHLDTDPQNDFRNEVRSYFGTGTQLQEMYITPSLLSQQNWDDLAEAANWSRANADTLKDTHWVGGDPAWLEPYGWASWSSKKGILVLRNPSDQPKSITLTLKDTLELPSGSPQTYAAKSPWKADAASSATALRATVPHTFKLEPFQVITLELLPR